MNWIFLPVHFFKVFYYYTHLYPTEFVISVVSFKIYFNILFLNLLNFCLKKHDRA
ncbi:MAG: hypothetical protein ACI9IL_000498, partial [Rickettsiales bacterium]